MDDVVVSWVVVPGVEGPDARGETEAIRPHMRRVHAHLERAERARARAEAATSEPAERSAVLWRFAHTIAAAQTLQIAAGPRTRADIRAERRAKQRVRPGRWSAA